MQSAHQQGSVGHQHLGPGVHDGVINGIRIRWQASAIPKIATATNRAFDNAEVAANIVDIVKEQAKIIAEYAAYQAAQSLNCGEAVIRTPPHDFSTNSSKQKHTDDWHVTVELRRSKEFKGSLSVHVYLGDVGSGVYAYHNAQVIGVSAGTAKWHNPALSWGYRNPTTPIASTRRQVAVTAGPSTAAYPTSSEATTASAGYSLVGTSATYPYSSVATASGYSMATTTANAPATTTAAITAATTTATATANNGWTLLPNRTWWYYINPANNGILFNPVVGSSSSGGNASQSHPKVELDARNNRWRWFDQQNNKWVWL